LTFGYELPADIVGSFKKLNTHALLELYVAYSNWQEACSLVKEYLTSIMVNKETERYDIKVFFI
jgi:hypothetical protein